MKRVKSAVKLNENDKEVMRLFLSLLTDEQLELLKNGGVKELETRYADHP
jgi:hypothetical protein